MGDSVVQGKLAKLLRMEISELLSQRFNYVKGTLVTVSVVRVTGDLSIAKIYVTVLPDSKHEEVVEKLTENVWEVRKALAARIRNKVRIIPELRFYLDDSFEEAKRIEDLLNNE